MLELHEQLVCGELNSSLNRRQKERWGEAEKEGARALGAHHVAHSVPVGNIELHTED